MSSGLSIPNEMVHKTMEACEKEGLCPEIWNVEDLFDEDYTGPYDLEVLDQDFEKFQKIVESVKKHKTKSKESQLLERLKECWPSKLKKGSAPKILYFVHNIAEWIAVSYFKKRKQMDIQKSWVFQQASRIEFLTRNIIADYRNR